MKPLICAVVVLSCLYAAKSARILAIFPAPSRSHYILGSELLQELASRGHEVTSVSPYPLKPPIPNFRDIHLKDVEENTQHLKQRLFEDHSTKFAFLRGINEMRTLMKIISEHPFKEPEFMKLLQSDEKFDLVIVDMFMNDAHFVLGHIFKAPVISFCGTGSNAFTDMITGNIAPYSFVPNILVPYSDRMTFLQRVTNTIVNVYLMFFYLFVNVPEQEEIYRRYFKDGPNLRSLVKNASLVFVNSHVATETPRPYLPNVIQIGGIQMKDPKKLPEDIQKFMDEAEHGVIFFSLGSNLKSSELRKEKRDMLVNALSKLKHRVLWKWEDDNIPGKPKNIKTGKWLPQTDILAHPNLKLFISHGGLGSFTEATYRGVPMLGIPFIGDQQYNINKCVGEGYCTKVAFENLTEEEFIAALNEMLSNPKYREIAQAKSRLMQDQPMKPLDKAVYWTEYVIRHKGAPHLVSASRDLGYVQFLLLDVIAFLAGIVLIAVGVVYLTLRTIYRRLRSKRVQPKKKRY